MIDIETKHIQQTGDHTEDEIISIQHLYKSFGDNHVLVDFSMQLHREQSVAVLGKSGSGKSVLIKCIIGLLKPDRGRIEVFGKNIPDLSPSEIDQLRVHIGFLFQSNALYDSMTVRENLEFPLRRHSVDLGRSEITNRIREALEDVGLEHTIDMMPADLSGGMRKRIALARTLILKPAIILYDEPTTGLDPITSKEIIGLMVNIQRKYRSASIIISHDMNCVRLAADSVLMLIDGKRHCQGTFDELRRTTDPAVKMFFE